MYTCLFASYIDVPVLINRWIQERKSTSMEQVFLLKESCWLCFSHHCMVTSNVATACTMWSNILSFVCIIYIKYKKYNIYDKDFYICTLVLCILFNTDFTSIVLTNKKILCQKYTDVGWPFFTNEIQFKITNNVIFQVDKILNAY